MELAIERSASGLAHRSAAFAAAAFLLLSTATRAYGQDMEPRAYSASPIDTNFLVAGYLRTTGSASLDPSLPVTGVKASINTGSIGYERTFDLFGRLGSAAIFVPYFQAEVSGEVFGSGTQVPRSGLGDIRLRFTENLVGSPALPHAAFAQRAPTTTVGLSLTIIAPTGDYNPNHLVNIGSNRWAFRPEIGLSQPLGPWFVDAAAGGWFFTSNPDFFMGNVRDEAPLWELQAHGGYNFRPGLWLAADAVFFSGGETRINGVPRADAQTGSRYGLTLSVPLREGLSAKLAWATWLTAHNAGSYNTIGVALQYRWFDP